MKRALRIVVEPLRRLGLAIGKINTFLILSISYFLVLFPIGLLRRAFSRKKIPSGWVEREPLKPDHFEKQF